MLQILFRLGRTGMANPLHCAANLPRFGDAFCKAISCRVMMENLRKIVCC
jgi:hypothetical protein